MRADAGAPQRPPGTTGLYRPLRWALLRAPLLPVDAVVTAADGRVRAALAEASPDLRQALDRPAPASARRAARAQQRLLRYLIRMRTRATPFGLLAGVALVRWGPVSDIAISSGPPRTRTRPDMAWLLAFVGDLEENEDIRRGLRLRADEALVIHGGRVFGGSGAEDEVSVRDTPAARRVLQEARSFTPRETLVEAVLRRPGATRQRAEALVDDLWRRGFLRTELRPPLTAEDPARYVLSRLRQIPTAPPVADRLAAALDLLGTVDASPVVGRTAPLSRAHRELSALRPVTAGSAATQVDMAWTMASDTLAASVGARAAEAAELLVRLHPHPTGPPHLAAYRQEFAERYGLHRKIPLLTLLDPHLGIGPPTPARPAAPTPRDRLLAQMAVDATRNRRAEVELDDQLLGRLCTWDPQPATAPRTLDLTVVLVAESPAAVDRGDFMLVVGPSGGVEGAGRGLGRFADLLGTPAYEALTEAAAADTAAELGRLMAEVVHAPLRPRSANVTVRPAIRSHEVVLGVPPGVPDTRVVPLDRLVVGATSERLYVTWADTGEEIVAVQTHMLNRAHAPPAARLLLDLATDGRCGIAGFDWGVLAGALPFLPRVRRDRVVLTPARWRLEAGQPSGVEGDLQQWRERWGVPQQVYLAAGDHRLLLDLAEPDHRSILEDELRRAGVAQVHEALPGPQSAWLPGPDGHRLPELVVPLELWRPAPAAGRQRGQSLQGPTGEALAADEADRLQLPGSQWLYLKLYVPVPFQDDVITGPLTEFATLSRQAGLSERWFFVRYADPDPHLRVRWQGAPATLVGDFLQQACAWAADLVRAGICHRFSIDTYEREVERYGGPAGMDAAESVFCADSVAVAEVIAGRRSGLVSHGSVTTAAVTVDDLLAVMGCDVTDRTRLYTQWAPLTRAGGEEHRHRQRTLRTLLGADFPAKSAGIDTLLSPRRTVLVDAPAPDVARSHVHMHLNRLLTPPTTEALVLELLRRTRTGLLRSRDAQARASSL